MPSKETVDKYSNYLAKQRPLLKATHQDHDNMDDNLDPEDTI